MNILHPYCEISPPSGVRVPLDLFRAGFANDLASPSWADNRANNNNLPVLPPQNITREQEKPTVLRYRVRDAVFTQMHFMRLLWSDAFSAPYASQRGGEVRRGELS